MSDVVISAEGLGKKYVIGHETSERYTALRDVIAQQGRRLLRSARDMAAGRALIAGDEREEFWALKDINFEIKRGEVVGIIGRNGAGKSTLLKVLSRITEPTEGRVTIDGRVASLLEVGTGFHPELTGRENIYLNGAILGMTRAEIRRKFDEIVAFAGVEKFLDTPVKRYSSGMYVRLAFSVAAHLEPEILVVDEVLAVGDAEFQKKCLGKMQDVAGGRRTVLFVSHNMAAVKSLCPSAILLDRGQLLRQGQTEHVISHYGHTALEPASRALGGTLKLETLRCEPSSPVSGEPFEIRISIACMGAERISQAAIVIYGASGARVGVIDLRRLGFLPITLSRQSLEIHATVRNATLVEGDYSVGLYLVTDDAARHHPDLFTMTVQPAAAAGFAPYPAKHRGILDFHFDGSSTISQLDGVAT
jgi:lipopolysaccharide transport system ATP-binding protein